MANIATKNPFDLLGDDSEPSQAPAASKVDKSVPKAGDKKAPAKPVHHEQRATRGGARPHRGDAVTGNEAAFRDRGAGSQQNRSRGTDESRGEYRGRGSRGRGRGGRGGRGGAPLDDRHSKTGVVDHEKQVGHGWGENTGTGEWADEQAGEAIAQADEKATEREDAADQNGEGAEPAEEEPKAKTYDDYLAEQAEKRAQVSAALALRKANEGTSKKLPQGKEFNREEEDEFITGTGGKKARDRAKKEKNLLELDGDAMRQTDRNTERRGRGGSRGSGPRGDFVPRGGGRGRGEGTRGRGEGTRGRGEGTRGRGDRGDFRGRGGRGAFGSHAPNVSDESAFPSLGS